MESRTPEPPPSEQYERLIDEFGKGWEKGAAERLAALFTEDAVFMPDPFVTPLRGRDAIQRYWKDIPREQAEITFKSGEIFVAGPAWFSVEFRCRFRRRRTGEWLDVRGALFCETAGDQISEMRMYWHRAAGDEANT
ncbi:MAG: nuclear transport factor 2 family protein [Gemmatimonadetes bacterium]|nr:nuclear transport factor 2 family protein [Gemmatimonadota bacterium]